MKKNSRYNLRIFLFFLVKSLPLKFIDMISLNFFPFWKHPEMVKPVKVLNCQALNSKDMLAQWWLTPAVTHHHWSFSVSQSPFDFEVHIFDFSSLYSSSYLGSLGQEFTVRHCEVPQVPKDPKHQTKEDDDRSRQDEEVPKTDRCKKTYEEKNQSDYVEQNGQEERDEAAPHSFLAVHLGEAQVRRANGRTAGWRAWRTNDKNLFFHKAFMKQLTHILT